jgi:membrane protease YdiL (CAAX protease family)
MTGAFHNSRRGLVDRLRDGIRQFARDVKDAGATLWHNRAVQIVILLLALPWAAAIADHRDPNVWVPLVMIAGIIFVYWFFTRRQPYTNLPVRRPVTETLATLIFVALWMLYREAEYLRVIVLPPLHFGFCDDLMDTIIPKMIEMVVAPLVLFLALRYTLAQLGFGLPVRAWVPALLPLLALLGEGLSHQKPEGLLTRTACFYLGAGLPEEFLFRGLLLSRVQSLTRRPVWGLFLGAFVFGVSHLPIDLHGAGWEHWPTALENAFTFQMSVGFALGFAFQRTRNLWPLTLLHGLIDAAPMV